LGNGSLINIEKNKAPQGTHIRSAALAVLAEFCGVSDISLKVSPLWKLKVGLIESPKLEVPVKIMSSGETADSCSNVSARGNEDLENIFVNVKNANKAEPLTVTYNMYGVKDHVIVHLDGVEMFDSGCISGSKPIQIPLTENSEKLKITIKALCDGGGGTAWTVGVTCSEEPPEEEPKSKACKEQTSELLALIDQAIIHSRPIINYYWGRANCYIEHHERMTKELYTLTKVSQPQKSNLCKNKKCDTKIVEYKNFKGLDFSGKANLEQYKEVPNKKSKGKYSLSKKTKGSGGSLNNTDERHNFLSGKGWLSKDDKKSSSSPKRSYKSTANGKIITDTDINLHADTNNDFDLREDPYLNNKSELHLGHKKLLFNTSVLKGNKEKKEKIDGELINPAESNLGSDEIFKKGKADFLLYKYKYCKKNSEDSELFTQVSFRYCLSAFRWLLR
jgi:hypothetical protein